MVSGIHKRTRADRVASIELPPGGVARLAQLARRGDVLLRLGLLLAAAVAIWAVTGSWEVPFAYRLGYTPQRDITARVAFEEFSQRLTDEARDRARAQVRYVYVHDSKPLEQVRAALQRRVVELTSATQLSELDPEVWREFSPPAVADAPPPDPEREAEAFLRFERLLHGEEALARFEKSLADALAPFEQRGLMVKLPQELDKGNQKEIFVHLPGQPTERQLVQVTDVLIGDGVAVEKSLKQHFGSDELAARVFHWLRPRLPTTLTLNEAETERAREDAAQEVPKQFTLHEAGKLLAKAGQPLATEQLRLLELENVNVNQRMSWRQRLARGASVLGVIGALYALCGYYIVVRERRLLQFNQFVTLLMVVVLTVALARWFAADGWRAEMIPLLLFGMTLTVAYNQELSLLISSALALLLVVTLGIQPTLSEFLVLSGVSATAILQLTRIRSRSKLIKVGFVTSVAAALLTVVAGIVEGQPLERELWQLAGTNALWAFVSGFLMTGLLPFIENLFGVLTEISLLELGDVAHPLLQELVRRAPGTYNHSINVASIGEAATEAIGGKGLLVRVGAYFHDIGKMLKPGYFVENMGQEGNRHDALVPAMSTLIIIAHIKDGADLARQHHLPQAIIDFIEQHHGTTLVEYFYKRAHELRGDQPDAPEVDESSFRYPGPKPQTREAAVLMLADAVESASRVLVEPTPARIEGLVNDIAMKRLLDGQFDECGLDLRELRTVQESLIKSLTAVYHGRVKYPNQRTA